MDSRVGASDIAFRELSAVLPQFAEILAHAIQATSCAIFAYSEDQLSTTALFRYGYANQGLEAHRWTDSLSPRENPAEAHVLETRQPLIRAKDADFQQYPLLNPGQERLEGRLTDLTIPLIWADHVQGVACLWRTLDPVPFCEEEIQTVLDLGQLAAMTIVFARQYEMERLQHQRLEMLLHAADVSASGRGLDHVLQVLARSIRTATEADVCSLYVYDEDQKEALAAYQDGLRAEEQAVFVASQYVPVGEVPAELKVQRTLGPLLVRDFERDLAHGSALSRYAISQNISEILILPIAWQSEAVGVVYCWYRKYDRRFSEPAIRTAEAIAQQAGGVVSRTRLEATIQRQTSESEALLRIGQSVMASETLEPVLDEIASALEDLIPFDYAYAGMLTADQLSIRVVREWGTDYQPILDSLIPVEASVSGTAVRDGRLLTSHSVGSDRRAWRNIPSGEPIQAVMVAPLTYDNHVLGTMLLARRSPRAFSAREEQLFTLLSQHAAVAIDRVQSRDELLRRVERQSFLARVGDLLVASDDPEHVLQDIAELAAGVVADGVVIGIAGWEYGAIKWVADAFSNHEMAEFLRNGLHNFDAEPLRDQLQNALVSNQEFSLSVSGESSEQQCLQGFLKSGGVTKIQVLPLYQQERAPGLMILLSRSTSPPFQEQDIELGRIVAHRIGEAIDRQLIKRNHEALLRTSEALHGQSDIDELIRTISIELERILPCDQLIIADVDRPQSMLHTKVYRKNGVEAPGREYFPMDEGMCGEALETRQPIMDNLADLRGTSVYGDRTEQAFYRNEGESALVTPLVVENEVIGVVFMNRTGHFRFSAIDFETFLLFAGLASAALDRTTLEQHYRELYRASTEVLTAVVDAKDPTTLEHSRHVAVYSRELAELMELAPEEVDRIELAGLLHDIGKLGIPDRILQEPGRLSKEEFELIKTHPDWGARILSWHPALENLIPLVRHHHEAYDGRGYPDGLEGNEVPIGAAIIGVADAFDTMTSERTYQAQRSVEEGLAELWRRAGTQFHPELVRRFVAKVSQDHSLVFTTASSADAG
jgi:putative nucleotidyltransferase with HDIG domain